MTYKKTIQKIRSVKHLIGSDAPKWSSPILEMIPAPANASFHKYIQAFKKTGDFKQAKQMVTADKFDILLIFRTPKIHGDLIYEWYSFFFKE